MLLVARARIAEEIERTRQALPDILDGLAGEGYRFVTVTELLDRAATSPS